MANTTLPALCLGVKVEPWVPLANSLVNLLEGEAVGSSRRKSLVDENAVVLVRFL